MLLDAVGAEVPASSSDGSELLVRLLQAKSRRDPTDISDLPDMEIDQWTNEAVVEERKAKAEEEILEQKKKAEEALDAEFGGKLEDNVASHASFTMNLMERLCSTIQEAGTFTEVPEVINAVAEAKALHEERLMLIDRITKLSSENVNLSAELHKAHQMKRQLQRDWNRSKQTQDDRKVDSTAASAPSADVKSEAQQASSINTDASHSTVREESSDVLAGTMDPAAVSSFQAKEKEMNRKISILEKQLAQSEADKAKTEMDLTQRIAQPLSQQDALVAHLKKAVDDLRQQCKQRVSAHQTDSLALRDKITNFEVAMRLLESSTAAKVTEITTQANTEVTSLRDQKKELESAMYKAKADVSLNSQLKDQVGELKSMETVAKNEATKLRERITTLLKNQNKLREHIKRAQEREETLEKELATTKGENYEAQQTIRMPELEEVEAPPEPSPTAKAPAKGNRKKWTKKKETKPAPVEEEGEVNDDVEIKPTASGSATKAPQAAITNDVTMSLASCQARLRDTQAELADAHSSINDLILEIEAVTAEEAKSREQAARVLQLVDDGQNGQRAICEENMKLQDQTSKLQQSQSDLENRLHTTSIALRQQEAVISQLVDTEQKCRSELQAQKASLSEAQGKVREMELMLQQADQKRAEAEHRSEAQVKRNEELFDRCKQMQGKLENERKTRMNAQREARSRASKKSSEEGGGAASAGDEGLLAMTLDMLRCSVCHDRFKEVAITRCYHLFCRECIDTNLANRQRKCPACGERFGFDDVKTVYFTH